MTKDQIEAWRGALTGLVHLLNEQAHGQLRNADKMDGGIQELCDLAIKGCARPEALRSTTQDEAVRAAWSELLEKVAIQAVLPPKQGYERRAIYLCVEDECDAGGEYVEVYDVSMEELNLLRGLLVPPRQYTPLHDFITRQEELDPADRDALYRGIWSLYSTTACPPDEPYVPSPLARSQEKP